MQLKIWKIVFGILIVIVLGMFLFFVNEFIKYIKMTPQEKAQARLELNCKQLRECEVKTTFVHTKDGAVWLVITRTNDVLTLAAPDTTIVEKPINDIAVQLERVVTLIDPFDKYMLISQEFVSQLASNAHARSRARK